MIEGKEYDYQESIKTKKSVKILIEILEDYSRSSLDNYKLL